MHLVHPMEVIGILIENGCAEIVVIAGILRDVIIEDIAQQQRHDTRHHEKRDRVKIWRRNLNKLCECEMLEEYREYVRKVFD